MLKQLTPARLITLVAIVLLTLYLVYRFTRGGDASVEYQTAPAELGDVVSRVSTSGSLQAVVTVDVGSQVSGRIQELYADFNSPVTKGQRIAKIDPALFQASVVQAEANVSAARANVTRLTVSAEDSERQARRASEVFEQRLISETERDTAVANSRSARASVDQGLSQLAQARAALEQARTNLRYTDIVSPTDGVVICARRERRPDRGGVTVGPVIFTIAQDLKKMEVHTNVAESDIGRLKPGMRVSFTVDAYPGEPFRGAIRDIRNAPQVVQNVVTYNAVIDVANDELKLKPGMTATVSVVTERRTDVLSVPNAALRFRPAGTEIPQGAAQRRQSGERAAGGEGGQRRPRDGGGEDGPAPVVKRSVYVLVNGEPVIREVTTGITDGRVTEVTGGTLQQGENVITGIVGQNPNQRGQGQRGFRIL